MHNPDFHNPNTSSGCLFNQHPACRSRFARRKGPYQEYSVAVIAAIDRDQTATQGCIYLNLFQQASLDVVYLQGDLITDIISKIDVYQTTGWIGINSEIAC